MSNTIYAINKGISRPLEFPELKAQYIGYLAAGLVAVLMLFSILYIAGYQRSDHQQRRHQSADGHAQVHEQV